MEEKLLNKRIYKIELYLLKIIPYLIMLCYFVNTTLSYNGINISLPSLIGGLSLFPWIFLYLSSYTFRFCFYHRLPLFYVLISDGIAYYDIEYGVPIADRTLFSLNCIIAGITIFIIAFCKIKYGKCNNKIHS